ncbi:MAG: toll/interleukin-1 receptor domain-containing protein [Pseudomonadota bacterium]
MFVREQTEHDNWNGGTFGHDVVLFVPHEAMALVDLDRQDEIFRRLSEDLNKATIDTEDEYVRATYVKPNDESDPEYQEARPFSREPQARPEDVGLWRTGALRLFISHRDEHKALAHQIATGLNGYGVSSFVAHDAIKPMREWQIEILNALKTMEVLLVLLTDDFHDSVWTNQEVGFALGKGIPILCMKLEGHDPQGFIGARQALKTSIDELGSAIPELHKALLNEVGQEGRLKDIMIEAFIGSESYPDAMSNLTRLTETTDRLTDSEFSKIATGYAKNDQLYGCAGIHNRGNWFKRYLESATGKTLEFKDRKILEKTVYSQDFDDEIPF